MIEEQTRKLAMTVSKLYRRGAERNIRKIIAKSREADIAAVLEELEIDERLSIFHLVPNVEMRAEIVSHMSEDSQKEIAHILGTEELQEILRQMNSDDAADFLGHLPEDLSKEILKGMSSEDMQEVEELLGYPEDSAGGLMTSEVLTMEEGTTVSDAILTIQGSEDDLITFYIYVVNESKQLVGVLSLKQLILHRPAVLLKDIMETDVISVDVNTEQVEVAKIVEKYDFLALPVTDNSNKMVGVITVDDVIDVIREEASEELLSRGMAGSTDNDSFWEHFKGRLPWFTLSLAFGVLSFYSLYRGLPRGEDGVSWDFICTIPLALFVVTLLSNQTATISVDRLRASVKPTVWRSFLWKEFMLAISLGVLLSGVGFLALVLLPLDIRNYYVFSLSFFVLVLLSVVISIFTPKLLNHWQGEVGVSAIPLASILSNIVSIFVIVAFANI